MIRTKGIVDFKDDAKEKKIAIVFDDEKTTLEIIVAAIEGEGFQVLETTEKPDR
ncbi:MAG: hypothetical protein M0P57_06945 [Syntrophales bacterium]|nr:hypothetical protein [Syntrophales bacterium]